MRSAGGADGVLAMSESKSYLEVLTPQPRFGQFGANEPGSDSSKNMLLKNLEASKIQGDLQLF